MYRGDQLPYVFSVINKVLFNKQVISIRVKLDFYLSKAYGIDAKLTDYDREIAISYPSEVKGYSDQAKLCDFPYSAIICSFYGTNSTIVLRNNKIQFNNSTIENFFKYTPDYEEDISTFDLDDVFALSTYINCNMDRDLVSLLIEQYKEMRKHGVSVKVSIQRYK